MLRSSWTVEEIDDVLGHTFPASDPPAWSTGIARPAPRTGAAAYSGGAEDAANGLRAPAPRHAPPQGAPERTFAQAFVSLLGAAGIGLLFPVVILAVGVPLALAGRGVFAAAQWLLALVR
jgi:hypothetical protein